MAEMTDLGASILVYRVLNRIRPVEMALFFKRLLRIRRREVRIPSGFTLWLDPVTHLGFQLLASGKYEPELCELLQGVLRPKDIFVDVGANEGFFSLMASKQVGTSGRVLAIEPQTRLHEVQTRNLALNGCGNVELCQVALSDRPGRMAFNLASEMNSGSSGFYAAARSRIETETVEVTTLDDLILEKGITTQIRLIKIDCEGAEREVLRGARKLISNRQADFVSVDFHEGITGFAAVKDIDTLFREHGYLLSRIANGIWIYHRKEIESELNALGPLRKIEL